MTKKFGGLTALDDVTFSVESGEIVGIVGPNGAGKTTVFNVISGHYRPTGGSVRFDGRDVTSRRPHELATAGIARTFQNIRLFSRLSALENVLIAMHPALKAGIAASILRPRWVVREEVSAVREAVELLKRVGLGNEVTSLAGSLPYGKQRRLEIARALAGRPRLLLLDEPAAGMNSEETEQLADMVRGIVAQGCTVVIIEHNMGLVMQLCSRIVVLDHGVKIAEGRPEEIQDDERVIEAYLGRRRRDA